MNNRFSNTGVLTIQRTDILLLAILLTMSTLAPLAGNQFISGTIVNCVLIFATSILGVSYGLLVGVIPSTVALAVGLLPAVLAPVVPYIILGNIVLVMAFAYLKNVNYWLGAIGGAVLKFGLLTGAASLVIGLMANGKAAANVAYMMSWPQLVTALAGGIAAFGLLHLRQKRIRS
jgi:hypothetical protein